MELSRDSLPIQRIAVSDQIQLGTGVDTRIVNLNSDAQVQVRMQWNRGSGV